MPNLLSSAINFHQRGRLVEAETLYRRILSIDSNQFEPQYLLAVLTQQQNRNSEALELIGAALEKRPDSVEALCTLAIVLGKVGRHGQALATWDKVLALRPDDPVTLINRGVALHELKRDGEALTSYDTAIALKSDAEDAYFNRGIALMSLNRVDQAVISFEKASAINPDDAEAHFNHGIALLRVGRPENALTSFDNAIALKPDDGESHFNRGNALVRLKRTADALASFNKAIACKPDYAEAHCNHGNVFLDLNRAADALASFDRAIAIRPDYAEAYFNRGNAMLKLKRPKDALTSYEKAIALKPNYAEAYFNRATVLTELGRPDDALASYTSAIAIKPDYGEALCNRGNILLELARPQDAVADYDRALAINPNDVIAGTNKIFASDFIPEIGFPEHQRLQYEWYRAHAAHFPPCNSHPNSRDPFRRLVIGYVSADFKQHSAAAAFGALLRHHNHVNFEVICYSDAAVEDALTRDLRSVADKWRAIYGLADAAVEAKIREDKIDIIVDLAGYTAGNRLLLFARKPAPVQVTHMTGKGIPVMDYLFADPITVPELVRPLFSVAIYDLPCLVHYEAPIYAPPVSTLPVSSRGFFTFGCLNRFQKVSSSVLELWASILHGVPRSRLLLKDRALDCPTHCARARDTLARYGIGSERVDLRGSSSHREHLAAFQDMDIALDPFPHNGGISTWEALWMGVPVVAKLGNSVTSRYSGAILCALGLSDWVAENDGTYAALAIKKAANLDALAQFRKGIRSTIKCSPAGNPVLYTRAVEEAYRDIWQRWCISNASAVAIDTGFEPTS